MNKTELLYHFPNVILLLLSAPMTWKGLMLVTGSQTPIIIVLSSDNEPAFYNRGDLLFVINTQNEPLRTGQLVVFKVAGRDTPIVHRVIRLHRNANGTKLLTKGDANAIDDRGLYPPGQYWMEDTDVLLGKVKGYVPYVGILAVIINQYPTWKYAIVGAVIVHVFRSNSVSFDQILGVIFVYLLSFGIS